MAQMTDILYQVLQLKGMSALKDPALLSACISDLTPSELDQKAKVLNRNLSAPICSLLFQGAMENQNKLKENIGKVELILQNDHGMSKENAAWMADAFYRAICRNKGYQAAAVNPVTPPSDTHVHSWIPATCTRPKTCRICGKTEGSALPAAQTRPSQNTHVHSWIPATCTRPKTCKLCGKTEGSALGHDYNIITKPATCGTNGTRTTTCRRCGHSTSTVIPATGNHSWIPATYKTPRTCRICGKTEGSALSITFTRAGRILKNTDINQKEKLGTQKHPLSVSFKTDTLIKAGTVTLDFTNARKNGYDGPAEMTVVIPSGLHHMELGSIVVGNQTIWCYISVIPDPKTVKPVTFTDVCGSIVGYWILETFVAWVFVAGFGNNIPLFASLLAAPWVGFWKTAGVVFLAVVLFQYKMCKKDAESNQIKKAIKEYETKYCKPIAK